MEVIGQDGQHRQQPEPPSAIPTQEKQRLLEWYDEERILSFSIGSTPHQINSLRSIGQSIFQREIRIIYVSISQMTQLSDEQMQTM